MIRPGQSYDERDPADPLGLTYAQRHISNINSIMERWMRDVSRGVVRLADGTGIIDGEVIECALGGQITRL